MPKAKTSRNMTLVDQIRVISDEVRKAAEAHAELDAHARQLEALMKKLAHAIGERNTRMAELVSKANSRQSESTVLAQLRGLEDSTNAVLLRVQSQMQREAQAFTAVSNVLKTRHDTVKNSIGNLR